MGISSLDAALSGLRVSQQQIDVVSNNVANVGTPGYTRKILPQESQAANGITIGVRANTIIRQVDINLERDLWTQQSSVGFYNVQSEYLGRVEAFHGPPDAELSFAAEVSRLQDSFLALADSPENTFLQASTVDEASDTANKINEFADFLTTLRNDAQNEISVTVERINGLLEQIANLNDEVESQLALGRSSASTEDQRSAAINELAGLIDITFFQRGDGVIVVQTNEGAELASDRFTPLSFDGVPLSPSSFYDPEDPNSIAGVFIGDPDVDQVTFDLTQRNIGGKLGGLLTVRDETLPKQTAQLDEFAYRLAQRFDAQGLRLYTDAAGNIPADTAPIPNPPGPATPVEYVGFATSIQVNQNIINDNTLIQRGTYGATLDSGSGEVIRRVLDFTFRDIDYQEAIGGLDLRVSLNAPPENTLQNFLGLQAQNSIDGSVDLTPANGYNSLADLLAAGGEEAFGLAPVPGETDTLVITFNDPDFGGSHDIELDLSAIAALPTSGSAGQDIINAILADPDFANAVTDFGANVSLGADGQLVFDSRGDITIAAGGVDPLSAVGFEFLGIAPGTFEASDPYFDVAVGRDSLTRITIEPNDTEVELLAKLQAVPGLAIEDLTLSVDGFLRVRPGDDYINPDFGGNFQIVSGPAQTSGAGANAVFGAGTIEDGLNVISALFGSFTAGPPAQDLGVINEIPYGAETNGALTPPIPTTAFRADFLGPNANISINVIGSSGLIDFAQKIVNEQTQELLLVNERAEDEDTLRNILSQELLNDSGVNLDEELGRLIVLQTAYAAAARVVTAVDQLFQELLNAV